MGYVMMVAGCATCGRVFSFNPVRVPSIRINGTKEPVCKDCIDRANPLRIAKGLPPITIQPGAYDPGPEEELA